MPHIHRYPKAAKAFFARWKQVWANRSAAGGEEEEERRNFLAEITGKPSLKTLNADEFGMVMLAMGAELYPDGGDPYLRSWARSSLERKILSLADGSDAYLDAIIARTNPTVRRWQALPFEDLRKLLFTMVAHVRRQVCKAPAPSPEPPAFVPEKAVPSPEPPPRTVAPVTR